MVVADAIISYLNPIREEISKLLNDTSYLMNILQYGADQAKEIAEVTTKEVRVKLGLRLKLTDKSNIKYKIKN